MRAALEGRVADGEMNYYRLLAFRELGGKPDAEAEQMRRLKAAIAEREKPLEVYAYAKFGGENTPLERVAHRAAESRYLAGLAALAEGKRGEAAEHFVATLKERPAMVWAKAMMR